MKTRRLNDSYQTPQNLADAVCISVEKLIGAQELIVEPSAGSGSFIRGARKVWPAARIDAVELCQEHRPVLEASLLGSAGTVYIEPWGDWKKNGYGLVIGNPPYGTAQQHLEIALKSVVQPTLNGHVAFLLRMSFLSTQKRVKTLWEAPNTGFKYLIPVAQRASFTGDGKADNSEYAVFVFQPGWQHGARIMPHIWTK